MIVTIDEKTVDYELVDDPLGRLLGDVRPIDWDDPKARARRIKVLEGVACAAAELITELLVQRATGRNLTTDDECVTRASNALVRLHRALVVYQRDTQLHDGLVVAEREIGEHYSTGIALLTLTALERVRARIMCET